MPKKLAPINPSDLRAAADRQEALGNIVTARVLREEADKCESREAK